MKRKTKYITQVLVLAALSAGCQKESSNEPVSYDLTFSTQMADQTKVAGQYTAKDLNSLSTFNVYGYDESKQIINGGEVKNKTENVWLLDGDPIAWGEGKTMTFWASANLPSWASVTSSSSSSATVSVTEVPTDAADQWDPLVGYYSGTGNGGNAIITFYHPMTAVKFVTGSLGDEIHSVTGITSVKIKNIYKSGTVTVNGTAPSTFSWTPGSTMIDVTGPFTGTGKDAKSAQPFILIPQNLGTKNVTLEITVSTTSGNKTMSAKLTSGEWQAGKTNVYTLDYINNEFGENMVVTLVDWQDLTSTSGDNYFNANYK